MCWNEPVSWTTLGIGTAVNAFNVVKYNDPLLNRITLLIQWLLLMQLFEALAWRDQECGKLNEFATNGALIANFTQPIVVFLAFMINNNDVSDYNKSVACFIILMYISYIMYSQNNSPNYSCINPTETCSHLELIWWRKTNGGVYVFTLFALFALLIRPIKVALFVGGYIAIALVVSMLFYSCSVGSMWCWFVAFAPILLSIFWKKIRD